MGEARKLVVSDYVQYIALGVGVLLLVVFVRQLAGVLVTFGLAAVLAYLLNPAVKSLEGRGAPRTAAVLGVFFMLGAVLAVGALVLLIPAARQVQALFANPQILVSGAAGIVDQARTLPLVGDQIQSLDQQRLTQMLRQNAPSAQSAFRILSGFVGGIFGVFGTILTLFLMIIVSIYLLIDRERVSGAALRAIPATVRDQAAEMFSVIESRLGRFIKGQLLLCAIMGLVGWAIMQFTIGRYAIVLGLWVGLTEFIPVIGAFLGAIPAVAIALLVNPVQGLIVAALFLIAQQIEGNLLVPKVIGDSVNLHPLWVLFGVMAASTLYGIIGALFAFPIMAIISATIDYLKPTLVFERWRKSAVYRAGSPEDGVESTDGASSSSTPSDIRSSGAPSFPGDRRGRQGE
ncbi:MAG: AI-2E family transporter [Rubrobacter sp.]|nr:AI-2E family transporter [Rubrobacter sp.]